MANFLEGVNIIRKSITLLVILAIGIWIWRKWDGIPSLSGWFSPEPVRIDETPLIIAEIKGIAALYTASLYCEVVTDSTVLTQTDAMVNVLKNTIPGGSFIPLGLTGSKRIVLVAKGRVNAGVDLAGLKEENIRVAGDSIFLSIPSANIMDVISNPSDFEIFMEEGEWSSNEIAAVKQKAVRQMTDEANRQGLINDANNRASSLMKSFLLTTGFSFVEVQINK